MSSERPSGQEPEARAAGGLKLNPKKIAVIVLWVVLASSFLLPDESTGGKIGRAAFFVTAIAHLVEFFIYKPKLEKAAGPMTQHFWQVIVFGMFHYEEVERELKSASRPPAPGASREEARDESRSPR